MVCNSVSIFCCASGAGGCGLALAAAGALAGDSVVAGAGVLTAAAAGTFLVAALGAVVASGGGETGVVSTGLVAGDGLASSPGSMDPAETALGGTSAGDCRLAEGAGLIRAGTLGRGTGVPATGC